MSESHTHDSGSKRVEVTPKSLQKGDRLSALSAENAVLQRMDGEWWCECKEWEWDCDIGPGGEIWCVKKCVRYECTPFGVGGLSGVLRAE